MSLIQTYYSYCFGVICKSTSNSKESNQTTHQKVCTNIPIPTDTIWICPFPWMLVSINCFYFCKYPRWKKNCMLAFNISLITTETEYLFKCLSATHIYFSVSYLFILLPIFLWAVFYFLLYLYNLLHILRTVTLYIWYKYLPPVGHLSYKFIYIVFYHIQNFLFLSPMFQFFFFFKVSRVPIFLYNSFHP